MTTPSTMPAEAMELRKIVAARSRGESANFKRDGIWLVYRSRIERPISRIKALVAKLGGTVNASGKSGATRKDAHGRTTGNPQPYWIEFDLSDRDVEVYVETGVVVGVNKKSELVMGRIPKR